MQSAVSAAACAVHASHGIPPTGQLCATTHADAPIIEANDTIVINHRQCQRLRQPVTDIALS